MAIDQDRHSAHQQERTHHISPEKAQRHPCRRELGKWNSRRDVGMEEIDGGEEDSRDGNPEASDNREASSRKGPGAAAESQIAEENGPEEALSGVGYDVWQMDQEDEKEGTVCPRE